MVIPFETLRKRIRRLDKVRRAAYVARFQARYAAWAAGDITLATLCTEAGAALEGYASEALDALMSASRTAPQSGPAPWIIDTYHDGLASVGAAIRDVIADSSARHAVAQTLQERVLRAESRLRAALESAPVAEPRK